MEKLCSVDDDLLCKPTLLQTLDAFVLSGMYIPKGPGLEVSLPELLDEDHVLYEKPGQVLYCSYDDHPYYFRREPDGHLVKRESPEEPDHATEADLPLIEKLQYQSVSGIFSVDAAHNIYSRELRTVSVYAWDRKPIAKYKLIGMIRSWYFNEFGVMCVVTTNGGFDRHDRNLLRVYRLELPTTN